ncbi:hypothetical protein FKP32DRAFT_1679359, partial [Trametes sanguinea]
MSSVPPSDLKVPERALPELQPATSARALMDVLALKTSLVTVTPAGNDGILHVRDVIEERELRALFAKAIMWYLEKEGINFAGTYVVFVGQEASEDATQMHPGLPVGTLWDLAAGLVLHGIKEDDVVDEFDSFMFHAAEHLPRGYDQSSWIHGALYG